MKNKNIFFYKKTGQYIDWGQLKKLPDVDIFIDVGFGPKGTMPLIKGFNPKYSILIDPLKESESFASKSLKKNKYDFFRCAVGSYNRELKLNIKKKLSYSSLLKNTKINFEERTISQRRVKVFTLDTIMKLVSNKKRWNKINKSSCKIGIKIDTEGYELEVIKGAKETLRKTEFVLLEARHNHISFHNQYKLSELMRLMSDNDFVLDKIITAKPFIADLYFIKIKNN